MSNIFFIREKYFHFLNFQLIIKLCLLGKDAHLVKKSFHYSWIILIVAFIGVMAAQGLRYSFGAFMVPWEEDFSATRGTISAISFVSFLVFAISQPVIGKLIDQYGIKKIFMYSTILLGFSTILTYFATSIWMLFLLFGVISSLGFGGASGVTASMAVTKWFHKKQGLALGLVEAGFGAGQMVMVSSSLLLIEQLGWKVTVLLLGGFLLFIIFPIIAIFLVSNPSNKGLKALGADEELPNDTNEGRENGIYYTTNRKSFYKHRAFWFLVIPYFICGYTTTGLMDTHLIPFAQSCGFTAVETGTAVSLLAFFNTAGTIVSGIFADRWSNKGMISAIYFLRGLTIVFLLIFTLNVQWLAFLVEHPWILFVFSISFGIVDFAVVAPTVKLLASYFKGPYLGVVTGFLFMSHQLGSAFGSYIPGILFDTTLNYTSSFASAAVLLLVAAVLSGFLPKSEGQLISNSKEITV
jgi:MFS family permease